ncbi:hypothetical protein [Parasitella parasitica]|uniref:RING-type domain-containing protein n=1 Tax=Parasitella parasitica TaxID=35722 RepID=A0A0B7N5M6_9FUNG|nr:hypothetical protein [Parasitella parasitica]
MDAELAPNEIQDNPDVVELDDSDFQAPIIIPDDHSKRKIDEVESEEDEEDIAVCGICQKEWTNNGMHCIAQMKCGHCFGRACIFLYKRDNSKNFKINCPLCGQVSAKRDIRKIWSTVLFPEKDEYIRSLQSELDELNKKLEQLALQNANVQKELLEKKILLGSFSENIDIIPPTSAQTLPVISASQDAQFCFQNKTMVRGEFFNVVDLNPLEDMAVVSAYQSSKGRHGFRKINMYDSSVTEFIPTNHQNTIRDIKHSTNSIVLSTGDDRTLKLTSVTKNLVIQSYRLDAPSMACSFDDTNPNLLYCGLTTGALMIYDIRNTKTHLSMLVDVEKKTPVISVMPKKDHIICTDQVSSYVWTLSGSTKEYISRPFHIVTDPKSLEFENGQRPTIYSASITENTCCVSKESNGMIKHEVKKVIDGDEALAMKDDWSFVINQKVPSICRNTHFTRDDDVFLCYAEEDFHEVWSRIFSFHFVDIEMEHYYSNLLEKFTEMEKSDKFLSLTGAILATIVTLCGVKMIFGTTKDKKSDYKKYRTIPTPSGSVFYFGHTLQMGNMPAHKITEWHKELGPIIRVKMFAKDWIFVGDSSMVHDIYSLDASLTSHRPHFILGNAIGRRDQRNVALADDGTKWKDVRSAVLRMLSPSSVKGFSQVLQDEAQRTVDHLIKRTRHHGSVDPLLIIRCASINVMLSTAFGHPGVRSPYDPLYKCIMNVSGASWEHEGFWGPFSMLSYLDRFFRNGYQTKRFINTVSYPQVQKLIQKARESKTDNLVKKIDLMRGEYDIDENDITVMMSELLVAGTDTVASSIAWTFAILCHYPEVQRKLGEEVDNFIRKHYRIPTFDDRLELPYYNAVQKECLRIRPPVYFGIPRAAAEDVVYRNYLIPKGSTIVSNIHTLHNDEYTFTEPEKFIPERFLHDASTMHARANGKLEDRDHYAFGWNNRVCPGIILAENEMFNIVTKVMARCTIKPTNLPNGQSVYPNLNDIRGRGAAVLPGPFRLRFIERDNRLIV